MTAQRSRLFHEIKLDGFRLMAPRDGALLHLAQLRAVINLKTAKALGIEAPPTLLAPTR
jgi:hypothetical protein